MRHDVIADLIAHSRGKLNDAAVLKFCSELTAQAQQDVAFVAPMIGFVARAVFDHTHSKVTELSRSPSRMAPESRVMSGLDLMPARRSERNFFDVHGGFREAAIDIEKSQTRD
jgi:hypothetical protein